MKVYYLEPDMFPGSFNFKDIAVGTAGAGTGFVTSAGDAAHFDIISDWQSHRKVGRIFDDDGSSYAIHDFDTNHNTGQIELYWGSNDVVAMNFRLYLRDGGDNCYFFRFVGSQIQDSAGTPLVATANNILYHLMIQWYADNTIDLTVNGVLELDGDALDVNMTTGLSRCLLRCYSNDNTKFAYIDAWSESWDTNYTMGQNLYKDWHVSTETEVTGIVSYPNPVQQNNSFSACSMILRDFEGSLYTVWSALDQVKMRIEDDSSNVIWRGFLDNKRFGAYGLVLELVSFGKQLEWKSFGSKEKVNYIMDKGIVDLTNASSIIDLKDDDSAPFTWTVDCWHDEGKDLGLMILDNTTDYTDRVWDVSAITEKNISSSGGNVASTQTFDDLDYYWGTDPEPQDGVIDLDIDGVVIADTNELKEIIVEYSFRLKIHATSAVDIGTGRFDLQIKKGTEWIPVKGVPTSRYLGDHTTNWVIGVPSTEENGNDLEWHYPSDDTDLQEFFDKDNGNYDSLKGLRFVFSGDSTGYLRGYIEYIKVTIKFHAEDVLPIMYSITDNAATTITCSEVADWQLMGITDDVDRFYIGQNTRKIIEDIAGESGVEIEIIDPGSSSTETVEPDGDDDCNWVTTGGNHFGEVIDANDATMVGYTGGVHDGLSEIFTCDTEILYPHAYISQLKVYTKGNVWNHADARPNVDLYWDGGWTLGSPTVELEVVDGVGSWTSNTFTGLWGSQTDLDNLKISYNAPEVIGGGRVGNIREVYIEATVIAPNWRKYMAREFKGNHCIDILKAVCNLEGAIWCEDHINEKIKILKPSDYEDSTISLTQANYDFDWDYEDQCNAIREVHVWGNSSNEVYANAKDLSVDSRVSRQIVDNTIMTNADAKEIADDLLALWNTKRPSLRLTLDGINPLLVLGTYTNITFARPTIAAADYKIKRIERSKKGISGHKTILYAGLGDTLWDEKIVKEIRLANYLAHKSMTDKL